LLGRITACVLKSKRIKQENPCNQYISRFVYTGFRAGKQSGLLNELRWRGSWRRRKIKIKGNMSRNVQFWVEA
jgi:hypothetical protein